MRTDQSQPVCPSCLAPAPREDHFCANCNAPLTSHATTDPVGEVLSRGYAYREATSGEQARIVVVGMWLLFGNLIILNAPAVFLPAHYLMQTIAQRGPFNIQFFSLLLFWLAALGAESVFIWVLFRVTTKHRSQRNRNHVENE